MNTTRKFCMVNGCVGDVQDPFKTFLQLDHVIYGKKFAYVNFVQLLLSFNALLSIVGKT